MAIIENKATAIGDVILIEAEAPIIGLIGLTDFIDTVTGETLTRFFRKEFRFSTTGGVIWSNWQELTNTNVAAISVLVTDIFRIEYRYIREGSAAFGELGFENVTLNGAFSQPICGTTYQNSIFAQFFSCTDTQVLLWCINVTQKLYERGIVPAYILRDGEDTSEDKDYLDFWSTVAMFFALIVTYARQFETFYNNPDLLLKYLRQRGMFICQMTGLEDMVYLMNNYLDEIRQRGTIQIVKKKGEDNKPVDGELLRLICFNRNCDEFIFHLAQNKYIGWKVGTSSPLYKGTRMQPELIKAYELTAEAENINSYPLRMEGASVVEVFEDDLNDLVSQIDILLINYNTIQVDKYVGIDISIDDGASFVTIQVLYTNNPYQLLQNLFNELDIAFGITGIRTLHSNQSIRIEWPVGIKVLYDNAHFIDVVNVQQSTRSVIRITNVGIGEKAGIGPSSNDPQTIALEQFGIVVDERVSYEITYLIKQKAVGTTITFGAFVYDDNGTQQDLRNIENDLSDNIFFSQEVLNQTDQYYLVRGIIFSKTTVARVNGEGVELELLKGKNTSHHLKFVDGICKMVPVVTIENATAADADVYIYDFKIRPLQTPHSLGFVNSPNFIQIWLKNNNASKTIKQIEEEIRHFLIPYNTSLYLLNLDSFEKKIVFKDFDFAIIRYIFPAEAGTNLDTRTAIINVDVSIDDIDVGFGRVYQVGPAPYYLNHAGDDTSVIGGKEVVLVDLKKIAIDFPIASPIDIRLRAFWGGTRLNGLITIEFETYKGGVMVPVGPDFINNGGMQIQKLSIQRVVNSEGGGAGNDGEDLAIVSYYPALKKAVIN